MLKSFAMILLRIEVSVESAASSRCHFSTATYVNCFFKAKESSENKKKDVRRRLREIRTSEKPDCMCEMPRIVNRSDVYDAAS